MLYWWNPFSSRGMNLDDCVYLLWSARSSFFPGILSFYFSYNNLSEDWPIGHGWMQPLILKNNFENRIKDEYLEHFLWKCQELNTTRPHWILANIFSGIWHSYFHRCVSYDLCGLHIGIKLLFTQTWQLKAIQWYLSYYMSYFLLYSLTDIITRQSVYFSESCLNFFLILSFWNILQPLMLITWINFNPSMDK